MDLDELYRFIRNSHIQAQSVVDTIRDPLLVLDGNLVVLSANPAYYTTFETTRDNTIGVPFLDLLVGQWDIAEFRHLLENVIPRSAAIRDYEIHVDLGESGERTMLVSAQRIYDPAYGARIILITIVDATVRQLKADEHDILAAELDHRLKNLLSVSQSLARQTQARGRSAQEFQADLLARFAALSRSLHASTSPETTALPALIHAVLEPYFLGESAITVADGPEVSLAAHQALPLGMILNELSTNAARHGALSAPDGKVTIEWHHETRDDARQWLTFTWTEFHGPPSKAPVAGGFGTRLITFAVERELHGSLDRTFGEEGFSATLQFPIERARSL